MNNGGHDSMITRVFVKCMPHPNLWRPTPFEVTNKHKYSPLVLETDILNRTSKSTTHLRKELEGYLSLAPDTNKHLKAFTRSRENFLKELSKAPQVKSFIEYIGELEEEAKKEIEEKEALMMEEVSEIPVIAKRRKEEEVKEEEEVSNLLDATQSAINEKNRGLERELKNYVNEFMTLLDWLLEQRQQADILKLKELLSTLVSVDVEYIASNDKFLGKEESLAIPLDFSPSRITLALLQADELKASRLFYPPLFPSPMVPKFMKPYRTLDGHPIMARVPTFDVDENQLRQDVDATKTTFGDEVGPLINAVKGLAGKREITPRLIKEKLVDIMRAYLTLNPMSIDNLKIMDLGCGSGEILMDTCARLLEDISFARQIHIQALLNDVLEGLGGRIRNASLEEGLSGIFDFQICKDDMINLIKRAYDKRERYDIAFINRVFDLYGGYGVFTFRLRGIEKETGPIKQHDWHTTSNAAELMAVDPPTGSKLIAYHGSVFHEKMWRALRLHLELSPEKNNWVFLPAVEMNVLKNFFGRAKEGGVDCFKKLLTIAKLVVVSVFPGSFQTLFPIEDPKIFHYHAPMPKKAQKVYSIICVSQDEDLIKYLKKSLKP